MPYEDQPSTYFIQGALGSKGERRRLDLQAQTIKEKLGGVLTEQPDPGRFRSVLDVGCGTGSWLIEVAKAYPEIEKLVGIDINRQMVEYAQEQVLLRQASNRIEFHVMDALNLKLCPQGYFDLVNQRLGISYLRTWDWPSIITSYQQITRPGGVIRITEADACCTANSPALQQLYTLLLDAFYAAGHLFTHEIGGLVDKLSALLRNYGVKDVQTHTLRLEYRSSDVAARPFFEDIKLFFRTIVPFLNKWIEVPLDYDKIYQQAMQETSEAYCVVQWRMVTIWGEN